ncbi:putative proteasome-type protease [Klebsiella pneumoniae]|jgi:putative proteasome-type protease|uniref:Putative proteasome-type protease n=1 Tax=Klebsiella pneumoniae TaxID=573 RepID=A0A2X3H3M8_KLEPN|nr:putative proteasome-type protease [Klebsiella pneumoniae]
MTYCVAMCLADGLVFASDSRTNAGVDHIATFKKLHVFHQEGNGCWCCNPPAIWPPPRA